MCDFIHQHDGAVGIRRILGVLALAKKHRPAVVEDAARAALEEETERFAVGLRHDRPEELAGMEGVPFPIPPSSLSVPSDDSTNVVPIE